MSEEILRQLSACPTLTVAELPVVTKYSVLPFEKLTWENFEKYCYCLGSKNIKCTDVSADYIYGRKGQKQDGIDLYFNNNGDVTVWQIKRYQEFTAKDIIAAVDKFMKGKWASKAKNFVLCVSNSLDDTSIVDTIDQQVEILKKIKIKFSVYNSQKLTNLSMYHPSIVSMFFGEHWVKALGLAGQTPKDNAESNTKWINTETGKVIENGEVLEVGNTKAVKMDNVFMVEVEMPDGKKIYSEFDTKTGNFLKNPSPYPISEYEIRISEELVLERKNGQVIIDNKKYYAEIGVLKFGGETLLIYDLITNKLAFDPHIKAPAGMKVYRNDTARYFSIIEKI